MARASAILADTIVIAVTWMRMHYQVKQVFDPNLRMRTGMVMLADGAWFAGCFSYSFKPTYGFQEAFTSCERQIPEQPVV